MVRFFKTLLLVLVVVAGVWLLLNKDNIRNPQDAVALAQRDLAAIGARTDGWSTPSWPLPAQPMTRSPRNDSGFGTQFSGGNDLVIAGSPHDAMPAAQKSPFKTASARQTRRSIRIASFHLDGAATLPDAAATALRLVDTCRRFDVIAMQGIQRSQQVIQLVQELNDVEAQSGAEAMRAEYRLLMDVRPVGDQSGLAIVYDARAIELDDQHWYLVRDPDDVLVHEPMVAWFRTRGVPADRAFTFSVANLQFDARRPDRELPYLTELFRAIRDDGRGEDDVIIAGTFHSGDRGLAPSGQKLGLSWAISGKPTDTNRRNQVSNIVFQPAATVEFAQQSGVFDFMKQYNLRLTDAMQISTQLPVWAEFNLEEGASGPSTGFRSVGFSTGPRTP
jgi:hypothetical protein